VRSWREFATRAILPQQFSLCIPIYAFAL